MKLNHSSTRVYFIGHDRGPAPKHSNIVLLIEFNRFLIPLTKFPSVMVRPDALDEAVSQRLLPLDGQWQKDLANIHRPGKSLPELIGHDEVTLRAFVSEYLFISLFKACAESLASENASRLAAMQRAEKNIASLLTDLNRTFYRLRRSSIDEELFDVISGFNALGKSVKFKTGSEKRPVGPRV